MQILERVYPADQLRRVVFNNAIRLGNEETNQLPTYPHSERLQICLDPEIEIAISLPTSGLAASNKYEPRLLRSDFSVISCYGLIEKDAGNMIEG